MSAVLSSVFGAGAQLFTDQGIILSAGKIYTYLASSTTPKATWTDSTQGVQNANPIILDSAGRVPNEIWIADSVSYKFILTDSVNNVLGTWDNIPGINQSSSTLSEWVAGLAPTYIDPTSFSVNGNQVAIYQVSRRVQYVLNSGTFYGTISTSSFGSGITTVVIVPDATNLDATLSAVNYGFMAAINYSIPTIFVPQFNAALTGNPTAPTQTQGNNSTRIATTAFVTTAVNAAKGITLLSTVTATNSATVDVEATFSATYDAYIIVASEVTAVNDGANLVCRFKVGGTYDTGNNYTRSITIDSSAQADDAYASLNSAGETGMLLTKGVGNAAGEHCNITMYLNNPSGTSLTKSCSWTGESNFTDGSITKAFGVGQNAATTALTGVRFYFSGGNVLTGSFRLYGLVNS